MVRRLSIGAAALLGAAAAGVFAAEDKEEAKRELFFVHVEHVKPSMMMDYEAATKEIIETLHHGQVSVKSEVGQGTTFELKLPIAE